MTHAELLRSHADLAIKEGGMYYSGEYLSRIATVAESLEAENAKLRELLAGVGQLLFTLDVDYCAACPRDGINHPCPVYTTSGGECLYKTDMRELGVEVE